jgi:hypothetical protein
MPVLFEEPTPYLDKFHAHVTDLQHRRIQDSSASAVLAHLPRCALLSTRLGYAAHQALRWGLGNRPIPAVHPMNTVLKTQAEVEASAAE